MIRASMPRIPGKHFLHNLVHGRTLLFQLVRRDFQQRFVGSAAGWVWGLIHPIVLLISWTFVFQICMKAPPPEGDLTSSYAAFMFCGFLPWLLFQDTVMRSTSSLVDHANLITKTVFPSEIIPVSIFLSSLMSHLLALVMVIIVVAIWLGHISAMVLLLPVYMVLLGLFAVGVGWIASSLHVYLRDTAQVTSVLLTFWFWLTPIFISEQMVPEQFRFLVRWNPLAYVVKAYRERLLSSKPPTVEEFVFIAAFAAAAFVAGGLFFRHLKRGFADVL
jgi:ABC-type polysaccharide/polyol phosphate export permease